MEQKTPKKDNKPIKKVGRKRINLDLEQVENLASRGLGTTQIARALGVSWNTIDRNRKRLGEFEDALKRGQAKGLAQVTNSLFTSATDGNVTAQIFYLKNQDPKTWKDRVENVHATINLNDVLSGAKDRLGDSMATMPKTKIINAVKSTSTGSEHLVNNQNDIKNNDNKGD
jgi:FAD/FMN-containing dehydrogenase